MIDDSMGRYKVHDKRMMLTSSDRKWDEVLMLTHNQLQTVVMREYNSKGGSSSSGKGGRSTPDG
jgi:hypothetical protein